MAVLTANVAFAAGKKPLDHTSYERWNRLSQSSMSHDGRWLLYTTSPAKGTPVMRLREIKTSRQYVLERSRSAKFSFDGKHIAYLQSPAKTTAPAKAAVPKTVPKTGAKTPAAKPTAKKTPAKPTTKKPTPTPTSLVIMELATGRTLTIERVSSFSMPVKAGRWIAYQTDVTDRERIAKPGTSTVRETETLSKSKKAAKPKSGDQRRTRRTSATRRSTTPSKPKTLVVRNLANRMEIRFPNVTQYKFASNGKRLAFSATAAASSDSGVFVLSTSNLQLQHVLVGKKNFRNLTFDTSGDHLGFFISPSASSTSEKTIFHWTAGEKTAALVVAAGKNGFPKARMIAPTSTVSFSHGGSRISFSTVKRPVKKRKTPTTKNTATKTVQVDIWHWKDPYLQPMQLLQARRERSRSYRAVVHLKSKKFVQLATEQIPSVTIGERGNANVAIGVSNLPYRIESSWDSPGYSDVYLVDVVTGKSQRVLRKVQSRLQLSPGGKYLVWWDRNQRAWMSLNIKTRKTANITAKFSHPLYDEQHDRPFGAEAYGPAGWMQDDAAILIYDKHDIWSVDPEGKRPAECVTDGYGRKHNLRFRRMRLDPDERSIAPKSMLYLSTSNLRTKATGVYRDRLGVKSPPVKLVMKDESLRVLGKARGSNDLLLTRSTFERYPDLWQTSTDFKTLRRLSDTNPQQKEYAWGKSELVEWTATDGQKLQGLLIKPPNFDAKKKYPMLVYFYERLSDRLHSYVSPSPVRASINLSFYASRGYLVFVPDITYKVGSPGESAMNSVVPGVKHLVAKGFVNEKAIGVQGHSWGGYQVAHLVTRTNIFAAAESGAPVSNMTSAYGGIRWSTGMSRMFQYEKTQSRIGATLWQARAKYLENSPLFYADKIKTPLLILHNDKDGAVPWYQGIELFVAMRRLSKPAWLLNYNGEQHGLTQLHNRKDFSIRMQQFFDHYLKGAAAPVWLAQGVPAIEKGKNTGLALVKKKTNKKTASASPKKSIAKAVKPGGLK